jgi:hypothetical protein
MKKLILALTLFLTIFLLFGCTGSDITLIAKNNPEIATFLSDYPSAKLLATYYTADQISQMSSEINQACETAITIEDYYRIKVDGLDNNASLIAWLRVSDKKVICVIKNSGMRLVQPVDKNCLDAEKEYTMLRGEFDKLYIIFGNLACSGPLIAVPIESVECSIYEKGIKELKQKIVDLNEQIDVCKTFLASSKNCEEELAKAQIELSELENAIQSFKNEEKQLKQEFCQKCELSECTIVYGPSSVGTLIGECINALSSTISNINQLKKEKNELINNISSLKTQIASCQSISVDSNEPLLISVIDSLGNIQTNSWAKGTGGDWKPELRNNSNDLYCSNCNIKIGDKIKFTIKANQENLDYKCYYEPTGGSFIEFTNWQSKNSCEWTVSNDAYGQSVHVIISIRNKNGLEYMGSGNGDDYTYLAYHASPQSSQTLECPSSCNDNDSCTTDYCNASTNYLCKHDNTGMYRTLLKNNTITFDGIGDIADIDNSINLTGDWKLGDCVPSTTTSHACLISPENEGVLTFEVTGANPWFKYYSLVGTEAKVYVDGQFLKIINADNSGFGITTDVYPDSSTNSIPQIPKHLIRVETGPYAIKIQEFNYQTYDTTIHIDQDAHSCTQ